MLASGSPPVPEFDLASILIGSPEGGTAAPTAEPARSLRRRRVNRRAETTGVTGRRPPSPRWHPRPREDAGLRRRGGRRGVGQVAALAPSRRPAGSRILGVSLPARPPPTAKIMCSQRSNATGAEAPERRRRRRTMFCLTAYDTNDRAQSRGPRARQEALGREPRGARHHKGHTPVRVLEAGRPPFEGVVHIFGPRPWLRRQAAALLVVGYDAHLLGRR